MTAFPKPAKPWRSAKYMAHVRGFQCAAPVRCWATDIEAHHHGPHAMGRKGSDATCIPLCRGHHRYYHDHGHLPGMTRAETDALAERSQRACMVAWIDLDDMSMDELRGMVER